MRAIFDKSNVVTMLTYTLVKVLETLLMHHKDLKAHGDTRTELAEFGDAILDILRDGCARANRTAEATLLKAKEAAGLGFWPRTLDLGAVRR